jgi:hypothetical protein
MEDQQPSTTEPVASATNAASPAEATTQDGPSPSPFSEQAVGEAAPQTDSEEW